jgi:hypothetical protein
MKPAVKKPPAKPGRKKSPDLDAIQTRLAVTRRHAARLKKGGVTENDVGSIEVAKLRRLTLECDKLEMQLKILSRDFVAVAKVREHFLAAFAGLRGELTQWESVLPPQLVGLDEKSMQPKIRALVDETLARLSEKQWPE